MNAGTEKPELQSDIVDKPSPDPDRPRILIVGNTPHVLGNTPLAEKTPVELRKLLQDYARKMTAEELFAAFIERHNGYRRAAKRAMQKAARDGNPWAPVIEYIAARVIAEAEETPLSKAYADAIVKHEEQGDSK